MYPTRERCSTDWKTVESRCYALTTCICNLHLHIHVNTIYNIRDQVGIKLVYIYQDFVEIYQLVSSEVPSAEEVHLKVRILAFMRLSYTSYNAHSIITCIYLYAGSAVDTRLPEFEQTGGLSKKEHDTLHALPRISCTTADPDTWQHHQVFRAR